MSILDIFGKKNNLKPEEQKNTVARLEPDINSDKFPPDEQKKIIEFIIADAEAGKEALTEYHTQRKKDIQHYCCEKPSMLENLKKDEWMSDRNLGLCPAVCDAYQAVLFSTCWNPETIHFIATESNDIDRKDNLEKFAKWAVGANESNVETDIDDFIHNRITQGFSLFKVYWKVWYEWVDRRIPNKRGGYDIKTEKKRFEKGIIQNIDDVDDILIPTYGDDIQQLSFFIHILHLTKNDISNLGKQGIFVNVDEEYIKKLESVNSDESKDNISAEKSLQLGLANTDTQGLSNFPVDLYEWYGMYEKGGKNEKYRFIIDFNTKTFLSGKPLRKINRFGKIPFVGGSFIRIPGKIPGKSLPNLIAPIVNAFNNVFNQKSDFQYVTNCPFGFHNPEEGYQKQAYELKPMISYPVNGKPADNVYFPNLSRSMAWADSDFRILLEMLERLTGAASFFMSNERGISGTATRDKIINEQSETRFGLWVKRIQRDICEALMMYVGLYQDFAPPDLGRRVLGKSGEKLFPNLSIETLRGNYDIQMYPDVLAGSKSMERQVQTLLIQSLSQSVWCNPQFNPKGNYNLYADLLKLLGKNDVVRYLGEEPPTTVGKSEDVENEWTRFMQGEDFDPPEGVSARAMEHVVGHLKQKADNFHKLDVEYRDNFERHLFKTAMNLRQFMQIQQHQAIADKMASEMIIARESGRSSIPSPLENNAVPGNQPMPDMGAEGLENNPPLM